MSNQTETDWIIQILFNLSNNETFINNDEKSDIKNKFLDFLHKHFKLNRIIVFFGFIAFILNLVSIIVFKNVFSFKVKYNIYLIFGPVTDCICSVLFIISYISVDIINDYDFVCYLYTYFINPVGYSFYCLSLTISLVISIDR